MFFMIGIGMATGIGLMPVATTATAFGLVLLVVLDYVGKHRRLICRRRLRCSDIKDPRTLEPELRRVIEQVATIRGSKVGLRRDELVIDLFGDAITSAGEAAEIVRKAGIELTGDVICEEI